MVISSFISSILVLALGIWAYLRLEPSMNLFAERQLLIEPSKFSYKMWKDMPVSMYQSFTFFNLTNWNQVKSMGQKPRFVEVGPYVYKTLWSKTDVNFIDEEKLVNFAEKKQWHFQAHLSKGHELDLIWTINTPLMTALALIQNAPVITRNIVSVILDGLGEGAFIKRPVKSLLFDGYSDLIVSVGPLFDRRFANFNGKFAYLYNKNDTVDGLWTVQTGTEDLGQLNKIMRYQSAIVNMTSFSSGQMPQGLNEVKAECAPAWSLDQSTNGQLFAPFNRDVELQKLQRQLQQIRARSLAKQSADERAPMVAASSRAGESIVQAPKRFLSRISSSVSSAANNNNQQQATPTQQQQQQQYQAAANSQHDSNVSGQQQQQQQQQQQNVVQDRLQQLKDFGKYIFYPDLCRPIHLLPSKQTVTSDNGIEASRYYIDPRVFMNSTQLPSNKCYEMNPRPALANALAATISSVTGANVNVPNLVAAGSSPFALFVPPNNHQQSHNDNGAGGLFERVNHHHPSSFLNNALHTLSATANQAADQLTSAATNNSPIGRLSRVRQLFSNIVSQRMSANPLLPNLSANPASLLMANHHNSNPLQHLSAARQAGPADQFAAAPSSLVAAQNPLSRQAHELAALDAQNNPSNVAAGHAGHAGQLGQFTGEPSKVLQPLPHPQTQPHHSTPIFNPQTPPGGNDRWITQFRFKWPRGVFSIGQCQLGAPIYVSLPHFLDADEYYLEQVDGLKPNRSLHEFYIDVESTLHSIPVGAKARLQLNIATPELRFRNIPNAMIPVLWQEVTFKIDKPIATMLYWSFTMSATIYKLVSVLLLAAGSLLLVFSFVSGYRGRAQPHRIGCRPAMMGAASRCGSLADTSQICDQDQPCDRLSCTSGSHHSSASGVGSTSDIVSPSHRRAHSQHSFVKRTGSSFHPAQVGSSLEGRRSSWRRVLGATHCCDNGRTSKLQQHCPCLLNPRNSLDGHNSPDRNHHNHNHRHHGHCQHQHHLHKLAPIGGLLNHAFASSCNEIHLDNSSVRKQARHHGSEGSSGPASSSESIANQQRQQQQQQHPSPLSSPKQPGWSRASSHCELMSSFGTITTSASNGTRLEPGACSSCLFSCLRHAPAREERAVASGPASVRGSSVDSNCETSDIGRQVRQNQHLQLQQKVQQQQQQHQQDREQKLRQEQSSASDTDKATLSSSRSSNLDSCSSIYATRKSRKFKLNN